MKINKGLVILIIICAFMCGCESESKEIKTNTIYPNQLGLNETKLMNLLEGSNSLAMLRLLSKYTVTASWLISRMGCNFELDDTFDLAIKSRDIEFSELINIGKTRTLSEILYAENLNKYFNN